MTIFTHYYPPYPAIAKDHATDLVDGVCGNCGSPAINAFENSCKECLEDHGLSTFPLYTYPSELMCNYKQHKDARTYFIFGY